MDKTTGTHRFIAALLLLAVCAVVSLAVQRYVDFGQERRLSSFRALAVSLALAADVGDGTDARAADAVTRAGRLVTAESPVTRVLFLRKGEQVPGLVIARAARVVAQQVRDPAVRDDQKLITLCAMLDQVAGAEGAPAAPDHRTLVWSDGAGRVVAAYPAFARGRFVGLAATEALPYLSAGVPGWVAAGLLAAALALFLLFVRVTRRPGWSFALAAAALLVAAAVLAAGYNREEARRFQKERSAAASLTLSHALLSRPEVATQLDDQWRDVFRAPAVGVRVDLDAESGRVEVREGEGALGDATTSRTLPVVIVLGLLLAIAVLLFAPLGDVVGGIVRMPGVYAYVAPAMLGMTALVLVPFVMGLGLGFFNMDYEFVGLTNFRDILFPSGKSDTNFYFTLGVTVLWTVLNVAAHVSLGLLLALILVSPKVRFKGLFRVLLIVPWAVPNYITALVWKWMFTSEMGAINLVLEAVGLRPVNWFGPSFWTNFFAALATNIWLGFPFMMVTAMGALQSIPGELYEAADIDGASRWQKFRRITLPLLKPALFPAVILGSIWTFNMFNIIFLVTRGNPDNQTNILITEAYRFFNELNQYGVAAAYCVLIFVILLTYTLITNRVTRATQGAFE